MFFFLLPAALAPAPQTPSPLSFQGFQAGMPVRDAVAHIRGSAGSLSCKPTLDWRMRDCTGQVTLAGLRAPFDVLISSIHDSAAVIVLSTRSADRLAAPWVARLTEELGRPNQQRQPGGASSWQWIRAGKMLRVIERKSAGRWETSVTLTHGPLLDGLGPTQKQKPE